MLSPKTVPSVASDWRWVEQAQNLYARMGESDGVGLVIAHGIELEARRFVGGYAFSQLDQLGEAGGSPDGVLVLILRRDEEQMAAARARGARDGSYGEGPAVSGASPDSLSQYVHESASLHYA